MLKRANLVVLGIIGFAPFATAVENQPSSNDFEMIQQYPNAIPYDESEIDEDDFRDLEDME